MATISHGLRFLAAAYPITNGVPNPHVSSGASAHNQETAVFVAGFCGGCGGCQYGCTARTIRTSDAKRLYYGR